MGFYNTLSGMQPQESTPLQQIREKYQENLDYLFAYILQECKNLSQQGQRQFVAYTRIVQDEDSGVYWMRWQSYAPEEQLAYYRENWTKAMTAAKGHAPADIRDNKEALFRFSVDRYFPEQSQLLRDRLLCDLKCKLLDEDFPIGCIEAVELPISLPVSFSFLSGKPTAYSQPCTCYYIKIAVEW